MVSIRYLMAVIAGTVFLAGCDLASNRSRPFRFDYQANAQDWCMSRPVDLPYDWKKVDTEPVAVDAVLLEAAIKLLEDRQCVELTREDYTRYTHKSPPAEGALLLMRSLAMPGSKTTLSRHNTQNVCWLSTGILSKSEVIPVTKQPVAVALPKKPETVYIDLSVTE